MKKNMNDDEFVEIKLKIPKKHLFFSYSADAITLRHYQEKYRQMPDDKGKVWVEDIDKYLDLCKARQSFFLIVSDDIIKHEIIKPLSDFIDEDEMEIV